MEKRSIKTQIKVLVVLLGIIQFLGQSSGLSRASDGSDFPRSSFGQAPVNPLLPSSEDLSEPPLVRTPGQIYIEQYATEIQNNRTPSSTTFQENTPRAPQSGIQEISLIAGDLGFFPKTVFVYPETQVKIYLTSTSSNTLCLVLDEFQVRKQIKNKEVEEISFTPQKPGQFRFYCPVNGASGTLVVREFSPEQLNAKRTIANE